ncbi:MAG: hypothetical protein KDK70_17230 [Myxococcales bacterium]|nr:hypothetical protein [Myxococcales bacterium]
MTDAPHPAPQARVPDLLVEQLALGELPPAQAQAVRERLGPAADERLSALRASDEALLREHPPHEVAAQLQRRLARLEPERAPARSWLVWAPMAAAAGVALLWWIGRGDPIEAEHGATSGPPELAEAQPPQVPDAKLPVADGGPEQILLKGDPVLMIDRVVEGRPQRVADDATVAAGELLQVQYNAKGAQQGVIVSIDGAGVATLHFPASEGDDATLHHGGPVPLPQSYELDDAPGFERFFFVTVDATEPRLDATQVMDAARRLAQGGQAREGALALPEGWRQQSVLLRK